MPEDWKPIIEPQRFIRLPRASAHLAPGGGYEPGDFASLGYLQATIDVAGVWDDLSRYIDQALDAAGIPKSQVRMEAMGVASGISLMVEQEPLIRRAKTRQAIFKVYETDLAKRTLLCTGNHYGMPALVSDAEKGTLVTAWPQPRLAINTPDKLEIGVGEVQAGLKSHLMLIMDWYDAGREEALEIAKQIAMDQKDLEGVNPDLTTLAAPNPNTPVDENPLENQRDAIADKKDDEAKDEEEEKGE
jgi:hypothetical protein